jgi:type IV pilus assembly protein PilQ
MKTTTMLRSVICLLVGVACGVIAQETPVTLAESNQAPEAPPTEQPLFIEEVPPAEAPSEVPSAPMTTGVESGSAAETAPATEPALEIASPAQAVISVETSAVSEKAQEQAAVQESAAAGPEKGTSNEAAAEEQESAQESVAELIELKPSEAAGAGPLPPPGAAKEGLISVTLDNVPLQDVVRMFARISGANIVSGTNLQGTVTVSLKDVEWQPALRTILDTAGMTLVMKSPGIYSVVSKSEAAAAPVTLETIYLRYTTVSNVLPIVQKMLVSSNSSAAAFPSANAVVVQETSERLQEIRAMVDRIDRPRPQVFIEAKFVELNDEAIKNLGINWQSLAGYTLSARDMVWKLNEDRQWKNTRTETWDQFDMRRRGDAVNRSYDIDGVASTTMSGPSAFKETPIGGGVGRTVVDTIEQGQDARLKIEDSFAKTVNDARAAILSAADFQLTLSALKQETGVSVVSNPRIIVASGETAKIHVGRKDPNYVTRNEPGSAAGTVITRRELSETLPFIETGVRVSVQPTVNTESNITLRMIPELSRVLTGGKEGDIPPIITRTITTEFNLDSGKTVAIGGLTSSDDREVVNKIPLLGDIPLIGKYLFRHTKTERKQDEVIIFVTVGLAGAEAMYTTIGIPSEGRLIHRHMAREATRIGTEPAPPPTK